MSGIFEGKCALVVGGTGFIGRCLSQRLEQHGGKAVPLGTTPSQTSSSSGSSNLYVDLCDGDSVGRALKSWEFDYVFNLAGYVDHSSFWKGGRLVINVHYTGLLNLLDNIDFARLERFVQVGSSDEYGNAGAPQREDMREEPISPYAAAKTAATHLIQMLARTEGFPGTVARLFLVYGPGQKSTRFVPQVIRGCLSNDSFPTSEGKQLRDFCYVDDIVDGLLDLATCSKADGEIVNIGSGEGVSIKNIIQKIVQITGSGKPQYGFHPYRSGENMELYADVTKARKLVGWKPKVSLDEGLRRTVDWYRRNM